MVSLGIYSGSWIAWTSSWEGGKSSPPSCWESQASSSMICVSLSWVAGAQVYTSCQGLSSPAMASVHRVPKRNGGSGNTLVSLLPQCFQVEVLHCGEIYSVTILQKVLVKEMNGDQGWVCWSVGELLAFQDPRSEEPCKTIQINDNKENWVPTYWVFSGQHQHLNWPTHYL